MVRGQPSQRLTTTPPQKFPKEEGSIKAGASLANIYVYHFERFCVYSSPDVDLLIFKFHLGLVYCYRLVVAVEVK